MKRFRAPLIVLSLVSMALIVAASVLPSAPDEVIVFKSPTCECCSKWITHLESHGFVVESHDVSDVRPVKRKHGVPEALAACHTALVGGYVIEGHVPAEDILRLLREKPSIVGLAVPGMPRGSPGMESRITESYEVLAFGADMRTSVFARH